MLGVRCRKTETYFMTILPLPYAVDLSDQSLKVLQLATCVRWEREASYPPVTATVLTEARVPDGWVVRGEIREPQRCGALLRRLINAKTSRWRRSPFTVAVLPDARSFHTTIRVIPENNESLTDAVTRVLPTAIPLPMERVGVTMRPLAINQTTSAQRTVAITAVPTAIVDAYTEMIVSAQLTPIALEPSAMAIARVASALPSTDRHTDTRRAHLILDLGATRTSAIIAHGITVIASFRIPISGNGITAAIAGALRVTPLAAEQAKCRTNLMHAPAGDQVAVAIARSLDPILDSVARIRLFAEQYLPESLQPKIITLVGGGAQQPGIETFLRDRTAIPVERLVLPGIIFSGSHLPSFNTSAWVTTLGIGLLAREPAYALTEEVATYPTV
ncbi:MAG: pilus assembly protein PilM [Candidatus Uhrbacteria bacterium]